MTNKTLSKAERLRRAREEKAGINIQNIESPVFLEMEKEKPVAVQETLVKEVKQELGIEEKETDVSCETSDSIKEEVHEDNKKKDKSTSQEGTFPDEIKNKTDELPVKESDKTDINVVAESEPVKATKTQNNETPDQDRVLEIKEYDLKTLVPWGTFMDAEVLNMFEYYAASHLVKRYDLINSIIDSHIKWEEKHPEFPEKEFVMKNIQKKNANKNTAAEKGHATLILSVPGRDFLKKRARSCCMAMCEFLEYIIPLYLSE